MPGAILSASLCLAAILPSCFSLSIDMPLQKTYNLYNLFRSKEDTYMSLFSSVRGVWERYVIAKRAKTVNKRLDSHIHKYTLPKDKAQQVKEYFAPYAKCALVSHNYYWEKTGNFFVNYMPEDFYFCYIDPFYNDWREGGHADNKCFYNRMYTGVKQPDSLAFRIKGLWYTEGYTPITREALDVLLAKEPEIVVKKAMGSEGGRGVFFIPGDQLSSVEGKIRDDILIQRPVRQHPGIAAINDSSVNTVRILSMLRPEGVKLYSALLRFGIKGSRVDNASGGGFFCGIDWDGKMKKTGYRVAGDKITQHPDSGIVFEGYEIPGFQKCCDAAKKLHLQTPRFRLISWDFSVGEDGEPVLVEANLYFGGLDLHQLTNGPLFGDDTKMILDEVFGKK